uniref:Lipoprotein n=1 Tax=Rhabditophanes sp. KR3021 TaxID=114890 RepID=A0AC35U349_9BILA
MMAQRPDGYYDPYGERLQQLKDEYLKRRMADAIIRPYPLAYSVFDDDTVLSDSVAGNRNRWNTISTFSNMFTGKKK